MCTVSWLREGSGYQLFCNRDERRTRREALPPAVHSRRGVQYISPTDAERGGTWLAVNQFGVALCLLNGFDDSHAGLRLVSRGVLIPELISASWAFEAVRHASAMDLTGFAPFVLVALEHEFPACLLIWDGQDKIPIANGDAFMPITSSSFDPSGVCEHRRAWFRALCGSRGSLDAAVLREFHASHGTGPSAFSPCMHRDDAQTVSFTQVSVSDTSVRLSYTPSAPCLQAPGLTLALTRTY